MIVIVKLILKNPSKLLGLIVMSGYTERSFSKKIGINNTTLSNLLHKKGYPSPTTARKIVEGIGKTVPDIFLVKVLSNDRQRT